MAYYVSSIARRERHPRSADRPGRRQRRQRRSRDRLDRRRADADPQPKASPRKELTESRQYLIGSMPRTLETNAGIASFLQTAEFFGLGLDYDVRLPDLLAAVTLDEVNAAARRVLDPERAAVVVAGPYQELTTRAVFFDVDFTLIYPGPDVSGEGYRRVLRAPRHRRSTVAASSARSPARRRSSISRRASSTTPRSSSLHPPHHRADGRPGTRLDACAREIYDEWAACQHFELYDDVRRCCASWRRAACESG